MKLRSTHPTPLQRVEHFFSATRWRPFSFQRKVWRAYLGGQSGLVHSATGTGKTLAVWMGPILQWMEISIENGPRAWGDRR